jgi:hypothetical protein
VSAQEQIHKLPKMLPWQLVELFLKLAKLFLQPMKLFLKLMELVL